MCIHVCTCVLTCTPREGSARTGLDSWGCLHCRLYWEGSDRQRGKPCIILNMSWANIRHILAQFSSNLISGAVVPMSQCLLQEGKPFYEVLPHFTPLDTRQLFTEMDKSSHKPWPLDSVLFRLLPSLWGWTCGRNAGVPRPSRGPWGGSEYLHPVPNHPQEI